MLLVLCLYILMLVLGIGNFLLESGLLMFNLMVLMILRMELNIGGVFY